MAPKKAAVAKAAVIRPQISLAKHPQSAGSGRGVAPGHRSQSKLVFKPPSSQSSQGSSGDASLAMVLLPDDDDAEAASGGEIAPTKSAPGGQVVSGAAALVDLVSCVFCEEECQWGDSTAYGRDPFKRWCKQCSNAYKCRMDMCKKETAVHGSSNTARHWRTLTKEQQREWYRNQKRKHEKGMRRSEMDALPEITVESTNSQTLETGRKRILVATTFTKFAERGLLLQKSASDIVAEWQELVMDRRNPREMLTTGHDGKQELALHLFDRVELYDDEKNSQDWRTRKTSTAASSADLPGLVQNQMDEFIAARTSGLFQAPVSAENQPVAWDADLADPELEPHLCPVPQTKEDFVEGPSMSHSFHEDLLRLVQSHEQSVAEHEANMRQEALDAMTERQKKDRLQDKKKPMTHARSLIAAKSVAQSQDLSISQKGDALATEAEVTKSLIQDSSISSKDTMLEAIDAALKNSKEFTDEILTKFRAKAAELDGADVGQDQMKTIKKELKSLVSEFCAESSIYKVSKCAVDAQTKVISQHLKKVHKSDRKNQDSAPAEDIWSNNPVALAVLGCTSISELTKEDELAGLLGSQAVKGIPDAPIVVKLAAALQWTEKIKNGQFFKTQKTFLQGWLKKNAGYTCQETGITVKLLQGELDKITKDLPVDLTVPAAALKEPWGKSFAWNFALSQKHCQVGVGSFCLGELLFGVEGLLGHSAA